MASTNGPTAQSMKATGKMVRCMGRARSNWETGGITKEASRRTRRKGTASIAGVMDACTWVPGKLENSTALAHLSKKMDGDSEDSGKTVKESPGSTTSSDR